LGLAPPEIHCVKDRLSWGLWSLAEAIGQTRSDEIFPEADFLVKNYTKSSWRSVVFSKAKLHFWTWTRFNDLKCKLIDLLQQITNAQISA
jgi:hypothetical protein